MKAIQCFDGDGRDPDETQEWTQLDLLAIRLSALDHSIPPNALTSLSLMQVQLVKDYEKMVKDHRAHVASIGQSLRQDLELMKKNYGIVRRV